MNIKSISSSKPIHKVIPIIQGMIVMQFQNMGAIPGLFGDAGIGKTANIEKLCSEQNWNLLNIHYGLKPLEEISGLPDFGTTVKIGETNIKKTHWTLPDILGDAYELASNGLPLVIFLDDFHTASPGNMALGYEMFTSKKLRGYPFPEKTAFILAANTSGTKSLANVIPSPIINRIAKFEVTIDFNYWKENYAIPNKINSKILAFLTNEKYNRYFQTEEIVNEPWCSARSWTNFSILFSALETYNKEYLNSIDPYYIAKAFLDEEVALVFARYYYLFNEIDFKRIFEDEQINIPEKLESQLVLIFGAIEYLIQHKNYNNDIKILSKLILEIGTENPEIAISGLKEIALIQKSMKMKTNIYQLLISNMKEMNFEKTSDLLSKINILI